MDYFDIAEAWSRDEIESNQVKRLRKAVARASNAPFYKRMMDEAGLAPESISYRVTYEELWQAMKSACSRTLTALGEISPRLPIGVPTIYSFPGIFSLPVCSVDFFGFLC